MFDSLNAFAPYIKCECGLPITFPTYFPKEFYCQMCGKHYETYVEKDGDKVVLKCRIIED